MIFFVFIIKFVVTNIIFSIIIYSILLKYINVNKKSNFETLVYNLSLGPACTTLILYYLFLFVPNRSNYFYMAIVVTIYSILGFAGRKFIFKIFIDSKKQLIINWKRSKKSWPTNILPVAIIISLISIYIIIYLKRVLAQPLLGHDILNYALTGRAIFNENSLSPIFTDTCSPINYIFKHPPSFSLLWSWEHVINNIFKINSDLYFKSIPCYYGLLIIGIQFYWIAKINKWLACLSVYALISGLAFYNALFTRHIDTYRILFYCISVIYLAYTVKNDDFYSLFMFGVFSGFTAFAHRSGLVFAFINAFAFFITIDTDFIRRIKKFAMLLLIITFFSGNYYMIAFFSGKRYWLQLK